MKINTLMLSCVILNRDFSSMNKDLWLNVYFVSKYLDELLSVF